MPDANLFPIPGRVLKMGRYSGFAGGTSGAARHETPSAVRSLNLALQGGGVRGAFTWGVLDRLLQESAFVFDGVSGTSAGAINAVLLAGGICEGGPEHARQKLDAFWRDISHGPESEFLTQAKSAMPQMDSANLVWNAPGFVADMFSRFMSPYQFNPLGFNPLKTVLENLVDFELIRKARLRVFISATDVANGRCKVFGPEEITLDAVLASTSLPHLHHAVQIGARHYWDGGYSANPALWPLVRYCSAADTLLVQLIPVFNASVPTTNVEIRDRLNHMIFSEPLRREIAVLLDGTDGPDNAGRCGSASGHRFHHIDATPFTQDLAPGSGLSSEWHLISRLRDLGRTAADMWLDEKAASVGARSTVNLAEKFLWTKAV